MEESEVKKTLITNYKKLEVCDYLYFFRNKKMYYEYVESILDLDYTLEYLEDKMY